MTWKRIQPILIGIVTALIIVRFDISLNLMLTLCLLLWISLTVYVVRERAKYRSARIIAAILLQRLNDMNAPYKEILMDIASHIKAGGNTALSNLWFRRSWVGIVLCEGGLYYTIGLTGLAFDFSQSLNEISTYRATTQLEWVLVRYLRYSWGLGDTLSFKNASDCPVLVEQELEDVLEVLKSLMELAKSRGQSRMVASEIEDYRDLLLPDYYLGSDVELDEDLNRFLGELVQIIRTNN